MVFNRNLRVSQQSLLSGLLPVDAFAIEFLNGFSNFKLLSTDMGSCGTLRRRGDKGRCLTQTLSQYL
jgi:hypothetical protein